MIVNNVKISNPDKVLFKDSNITKGDVALYYKAVAERMMSYVKGRVLSFVVCPQGIGEECFYKKHPNPHELIKTVEIGDNQGAYIIEAAGILAQVQMNTLEFHVWGSRVESLDKPDIMVFDLDPDEGMDISQVRQGVLDLKSVLDELGLCSFLKTSGNKGYHVVVPFGASVGWETFGCFAKRIAQFMETKWQSKYTSNVRKASRKGRIFIDWIRNGKGATSIAPYSIRAKSGARVSMPIAWAELSEVAPNGITMQEAIARIKKPDPWVRFFKVQEGQFMKQSTHR